MSRKAWRTDSPLLTAQEAARIDTKGFCRIPDRYDYVYAYPPLNALPVVDSESIPAVIFSDAPVQLYIHIPFCTCVCSFCDFRVLPVGRPHDWGPVARYLHALFGELDLVLASCGTPVIDTVFIGGGTPSILPPALLEELLNGLRQRLPLPPRVEVTMEFAPEWCDAERLAAARENGVNRVSLGVQSLNPEVLRLMNRVHDPRASIEAVEAIKSAGFRNFNIDFVIGLPEDSADDVDAAISWIDNAEIPCVTWYHFWRVLNTPLAAHAREVGLPSGIESALHYAHIASRLMELGFSADCARWWVRGDEFRFRHQSGKWGADAIEVGIGLSAYGFRGGFEYANTRDLKTYYAAIERGSLPIELGRQLTPEEEVRRQCALSLKTPSGIPTSRVPPGPLPTIRTLSDGWLDVALDLNLVELKDNSVRLTSTGQMYDDELAEMFFDSSSRRCLGKSLGDNLHRPYSLAWR